MLDLKKYEKRAEENPNFKAKLLENANQAIKEEFREDLPYKLKCKSKLVFEIEPMENLSDRALKCTSGGILPDQSGYTCRADVYGDKSGYNCQADVYGDKSGYNCRADVYGDKSGYTCRAGIYGDEPMEIESEPIYTISDNNLGGVAGGEGQGEVQNLPPAPLFSNHSRIENVCLSPAPVDDIDLKGVAGGGENNVDYEFSARPKLPTLDRANGRLGARPYPKAFPPSFRKSSWRRVYHPGNYDDFLVEAPRNLSNKARGGFFE